METKVKIAFQSPETMLFGIGDMGQPPDHKLTQAELEILMDLMPSYRFIIVKWSHPQQTETLKQ